MTSRVQHRWETSGGHGASTCTLASVILLYALLVTAQTLKAQTSSGAFTYEVLYTFTGGADGGTPAAGVIRDAQGNLYGTTENTGTDGWGVVFKLDPNGKETVLHSFTGGPDGATPRANLIMDSVGNLYGTTYQGGAPCGPFTCGVVFKLDTAGSETVLYTFTGGADGGNPEAPVMMDAAGNLYGTALIGGSGFGVVFKLDPTNGNYTVLHTFSGGADGGQPFAGLIQDGAGNLYGTASFGGLSGGCNGGGCGVVFKLDPTTGNYTVLYTFTGGADGGEPGPLIQDSAGNFYGNAGAGGSGCCNYGVVFSLDATTGKETVLYNIIGGADGWQDQAGLFLDANGNLYGVLAQGGLSGGCGGGGCGVIFKLDPTTGNYTLLYTFTGGADGGEPVANLIEDSAGNFYGTASLGGSSTTVCGLGCGTVFKLATTEASFSVSVALAGDGGGTVTSNPAGINCGTSCSANFVSGSTVTLIATPAAGSDFYGWSGNCSGTGGCSVTAGASVTASFDLLGPDFSLTPTSASLTIQPGGRGTDVLIIEPQNGSFGNAIQLSCMVAGPSPMPTCGLSSSSVTPGAGSATSTLTINAPNAAAVRLPTGPSHLLRSFYALWLPLLLGIPVIGEAKKKRARCGMLFGFVLLLMVLQTACGGSASNGGGHGATSYTVTVTGTSSAIQHSTQVTVTVQK